LAFVSTPGGLEVVMNYLQSAQKLANVFHVQVDDPTSGTVRQQIAQAFYDWWVAEMAPLTSGAVELTDVLVRDIENELGGQYTLVPPTLTVGALSEEALPNNVTLAVAARTALSGRSYRGRTYFVGLTDNNVIANETPTDFVTSVQNALAALQNTYIEQGVLAVLSMVNNKTPRVAGVLTPIIAWLVTDRIVDSQRRRLPGRGR